MVCRNHKLCFNFATEIRYGILELGFDDVLDLGFIANMIFDDVLMMFLIWVLMIF
ncbi:hypothetical protein Hanom_Chr13g01198421 [Helianthus anomalus]